MAKELTEDDVRALIEECVKHGWVEPVAKTISGEPVYTLTKKGIDRVKSLKKQPLGV